MEREAKDEARTAAEQAGPSATLAAAGLLVAGVGGALALTIPAVSTRHRAVRRRMLGLSGLYLAGGTFAAVAGGLAVRSVLEARARRVTDRLERGASGVARELDPERHS